MHFKNDTDLYRVIGANIKHYREQAKLTQVQLAERAKSASAIYQKSRPPAVIRVFLSRCLTRLQMHLVLRSANF